MSIQSLLKYPWFKPLLGSKEQDYVKEAVASSWISTGPFVTQFEDAFAKRLGVPYAVSTSNGTAALYAALLAIGIKEGDEVIVPGFTFVAAINMVLALGAKPVIVDVNIDTWCIDGEKIRPFLSPKTKAICVVHLYGNSCDMESIVALAKEFNLKVVEDAAQAHFSKYHGKCCGTMGDVGTFSFHATKTLTMGEGGCVVSNSQAIADHVRVLSNHGLRSRGQYNHEMIGHNFRLSNIHAAMGVAQLEQVDCLLREKRRVYNLYVERLSHLEGVTFQHAVDAKGVVFWAFAFRVDASIIGVSRDEIMKALMAQGIETRPGYRAAAGMPLYKNYVKGSFDNAHRLSEEVISLPSYSQLTENDVSVICQTLLKVIHKS